MTYLIFDLVIVLLLLLSMLQGRRRGFVLTLCSFLAVFVALIGATVVSNALAQPMSQVLRPAIQSSLQQLVDRQTAPDASFRDDATLDTSEQEEPTLPLDELLTLLKDSRLYRGFADALHHAADEGRVSAAANAVRLVSDYIAGQVAHTVLFLVSFLLILVLWSLLSRVLDLAFRLPVLSALNAWTGGLLGLCKGSLLLFIACWLLKGSLIPQDAIQNTYLLNFFCTVSPLTLLS